MGRHTPLERRGFFGVGVQEMKTPANFGSLFRTAQIFGAAFLFTIGPRFKPQVSDTMKSWRHMPVFEYQSFQEFYAHMPYDCRLIGVELDERAIPLASLSHPERAVYLLGAEDHGLSNEAIKGCHQLVKLPGERSLNVSVAGSIVLYDRITRE